MEFFISLFIIMIISSIVSEYFKKKTETKKNNQSRANIEQEERDNIVSKA